MPKHTYNIGDDVAILNNKLNGEAIFEGFARIKKRLGTDEYYEVRFQGDRLKGYPETYDRFVDPDPLCQSDPEEYCRQLNRKAA